MMARRLFAVLAFLIAPSCLRLHAQAAASPPPPLKRLVTLDVHDARLEDVLKEIDRQADIGLSYTPIIVPVDRRVSLQAKRMSVGDALEKLLRGTGVQAKVTSAGRVVLLRRSERAMVGGAGAVVVHVLDSATSRPLAGVVFGVKGTTLTSTTNEHGYGALLSVPAGLQIITVRYFGYVPAQQEVVVPDSQSVTAEFVLHMTMSRLQEVVTTATGLRRRVEVSNDITIIHVDSVLATAPITSVTDLLETRVPGLTVQRTSGAPGDPARLRLRGVSSIYGNNDPIIVVDGVRVYSAQSDERSANLAGGLGAGVFTAAPSPLDQIDPQSIETIEVLKGPSAATLYGADAANGVIVITTKRGRPGPAHWRATVSHGISNMPGSYPEAYFAFGHSYSGGLLFCSLTSNCGVGMDSLVRFQALNARDLTILDQGSGTQFSLGVDGGSNALTYNLTGSYDDEKGILDLPSFAAQQFQEQHGYAAPDWMQRPQTLSRWSATGRVTAVLGSSADASITTTLTREIQQRSSLEQQLSVLMSTYVDRSTGAYYQVDANGLRQVSVLVPDFYRRATDAATNFTNAATVNWRPRTWLTTSADAGLNVIARNDELLLPRDMLDTLGSLTSARGSSLVSTVNLRALATAPLFWGFRLQFATGANYLKTSIADLSTSVLGLAEGRTGLSGAGKVVASSENVNDETILGWYVEPSLAHKRFFLSAGLRFDGGSTYGNHVALPTFPKLGASWLISDEHWFPLKSVLDNLRLRVAYGHAGVQPGITDRLRLYTGSESYFDGGLAQVTNIENLGNTKLRPERSTEFEGGFDADLFNDRVSVTFSGYRKIRKDALLEVPVAPSVYGIGITTWKNIGVIRNTGVEATITTQLVRTDPLTWSATLGVSKNRNLVVSLAPGMEPFDLGNGERVAAGYPLFGRWAKPIKGFADVNGDEIIEANEVQVGDSLVFMGESLPSYETSLHSTLSLLRGAIAVDVGLDYQNGLTQVNQTVRTNRVLSRGANDPSAPFREQAAIAALDRTDYGLIQTVNTLRFNSLSVTYNTPTFIAQRLGMSALSIAVQGSNLGLFTNYAGKDPNVNAYPTGNTVADRGVLPQPRSWRLTLNARY